MFVDISIVDISITGRGENDHATQGDPLATGNCFRRPIMETLKEIAYLNN